MSQRGKDRMAGKDIADTWRVPFAMAPVCGTYMSAVDNKDYPANNTVVFHQLFPDPGYRNDFYVRLK
jgi:hypothetical protein